MDSDEKDFVLRQIGIGICVPEDEDHDMVVSGNRLDALGLRFTTVQKMVLDAAEAELAEGRIIARTATFARFAPRPLSFSQASTAASTSITLFAWSERPDAFESALVHPPRFRTYDRPRRNWSGLERIPSIIVTLTCTRSGFWYVPFSWSFAMKSLPPGRSLRVPARAR